MYYVPDGTERCGYYECRKCGTRFLDTRIEDLLECPECGEEADDMELGPDEVPAEQEKTAVLTKVIEGAEEVELYDGLLSLAITGGNYEGL